MIQGGLFTRDFLPEGVIAEPAWHEMGEDRVKTAHARLAELFARFIRHRAPNEAETESQLIFPMIEEVLGWPDWLPQQNHRPGRVLEKPERLDPTLSPPPSATPRRPGANFQSPK